MRKVQHTIRISVDRVSFNDVIILSYSDYSRAELMKLVEWIESGLIGLSYNIEISTYIDQVPDGQSDDQISKCAD